MTIEASLQSIDASLKAILALAQQNAIPEDQSGIAGAGADPLVAKQVGAAIAAAGAGAVIAAGGAAATPEAPTRARGRGRPARTDVPATPEAPPAPPAPETADPFSIGVATAAVVEKPRSMEEVRAALLVYQARHGQPAAVQLIVAVTGKETLAKLVDTDLPKLFKAAIPAGEFSVEDVKVVLVKAEERKPQGGLAVLEKYGASVKNDKGETVVSINHLTPDKYIAVINAAHAVK